MAPNYQTHHRDTEGTEPLTGDDLTGEIIGAAIEVHRHLGPGLLESAYEACLAFELVARGLRVERQVVLPVHYLCALCASVVSKTVFTDNGLEEMPRGRHRGH